MSPALIRDARTADVPALVALMGEFYAESGYPLPAAAAAHAFRAVIEQARFGRVWLIEHDAEPAGHLVLTFAFSMEYGGLRGFIDDLFVRPRFRGRGFAAAALAHARRAALEHGVRALFVEAGPDNPVARRLYARAGFRETGRLLLAQALAAPTHES